MKDGPDSHIGNWKLDDWITEGLCYTFNAPTERDRGWASHGALSLIFSLDDWKPICDYSNSRSVKCNNVPLVYERLDFWTHW